MFFFFFLILFLTADKHKQQQNEENDFALELMGHLTDAARRQVSRAFDLHVVQDDSCPDGYIPTCLLVRAVRRGLNRQPPSHVINTFLEQEIEARDSAVVDRKTFEELCARCEEQPRDDEAAQQVQHVVGSVFRERPTLTIAEFRQQLLQEPDAGAVPLSDTEVKLVVRELERAVQSRRLYDDTSIDENRDVVAAKDVELFLLRGTVEPWRTAASSHAVTPTHGFVGAPSDGSFSAMPYTLQVPPTIVPFADTHSALVDPRTCSSQSNDSMAAPADRGNANLSIALSDPSRPPSSIGVVSPPQAGLERIQPSTDASDPPPSHAPAASQVQDGKRSKSFKQDSCCTIS